MLIIQRFIAKLRVFANYCLPKETNVLHLSRSWHERKKGKWNKEVGFHAQMHFLRVDKHVNGIRLVDTKCFFENIWKSCTTIFSLYEQTCPSGIKKDTENETSLRISEILIYILHALHLQTMRSSKIATVAKCSTFVWIDNDNSTTTLPRYWITIRSNYNGWLNCKIAEWIVISTPAVNTNNKLLSRLVSHFDIFPIMAIINERETNNLCGLIQIVQIIIGVIGGIIIQGVSHRSDILCMTGITLVKKIRFCQWWCISYGLSLIFKVCFFNIKDV